MMRDSLRRRDRRGGFTAARVAAFFFALILCSFSGAARADWTPLVQRLSADGFEAGSLQELFSRPGVEFDPTIMSRKIEALVRNRYGKPAAPGPRKSGRVYRGFVRPEVIAGARSYLSENKEVLEEVRAKYGVPKEIIVSILLVETRLGEYVGKKSAFNTLASMARCCDLEIIRPYVDDEVLTPKHEEFARRKLGEKSNWAYRELKALLAYAGQVGLDPAQIPGSFYGAIGICQFMPSHAKNFGVDGDKDGRIDLFSRQDAFHSMANYLKGHGWKSRMSREKKFKVIRAYNASNTYANTVLAVADKLTVKTLAKRPAKRKLAQINPA